MLWKKHILIVPLFKHILTVIIWLSGYFLFKIKWITGISISKFSNINNMSLKTDVLTTIYLCIVYFAYAVNKYSATSKCYFCIYIIWISVSSWRVCNWSSAFNKCICIKIYKLDKSYKLEFYIVFLHHDLF